jgi:hypothetical protein
LYPTIPWQGHVPFLLAEHPVATRLKAIKKSDNSFTVCFIVIRLQFKLFSQKNIVLLCQMLKILTKGPKSHASWLLRWIGDLGIQLAASLYYGSL